MNDLCTDNRFELIEKYKKELIESTNIETDPEEMKVIDNILFRFWQMGWLDKLELTSAEPETHKKHTETHECVLINKQDAIDYFVTNVGFHDEDGYPIDDSDELRKIWTDYFDGIPSAQPKIKTGRMSNKNWIDFLCEQFDISRTSARDMLHGMMKYKKEDNFKRVFNPMQKDGD